MSDPRDLAEAARQAVGQESQGDRRRGCGNGPAQGRRQGRAAKPQTVPPRPTRELAGARPPRPRDSAAAASDRRSFIASTVAWIIVGWITFTAAISAMTLMTVRFMFPNVLAEPPSTIKIGLPSRLSSPKTSAIGTRPNGASGSSGRPDTTGRISSTRCNRSARTWAARPTGWPPSRNSSARATEAGSTSPGSTSRARRPGRSSASRLRSPTTVRSWSTRARRSSKSWVSGPIRIASSRFDSSGPGTDRRRSGSDLAARVRPRHCSSSLRP